MYKNVVPLPSRFDHQLQFLERSLGELKAPLFDQGGPNVLGHVPLA
jgi:hypothetical protein